MGEGSSVETIRGGCPICRGNVKGNDKYLYLCEKCFLLYRREHLQLSKEQIENMVKARIIHTHSHRKDDLKQGIEKRPVKEGGGVKGWKAGRK